jgi:hypothetical protein
MERGQVMRDIKKLVGLCVCLMMVISGSIAMAHDDGDGETKGLKSKESEGLCYGTAPFSVTTPATVLTWISASFVILFSCKAVLTFAVIAVSEIAVTVP